jgi:electron transfer flavoprotein alpha/beta subunit
LVGNHKLNSEKLNPSWRYGAMLIICLLKGVPAKTTQVVTVSGVLKREEMELVLNPHDVKVLEAAYYVKRDYGR